MPKVLMDWRQRKGKENDEMKTKDQTPSLLEIAGTQKDVVD